MDHTKPGDDPSSLAQDILGYLNFSSGTPDPRFLKNLDELFGRIAGRTGGAGTGLAGPGQSAARRVAGGPRRDATPFDRSIRPKRCWGSCLTPSCRPTASSTATCCSTRPRRRCFSRFSSAGCARPYCSRAGRGTSPIASCRPPCTS